MSSRYCTSKAAPAARAGSSNGAAPTSSAAGTRTGAIGVEPAPRTSTSASRMSTKPCPPASTTPARASTSSCSGVRRRASSAAASATPATSAGVLAVGDGPRGRRGDAEDGALDRIGHRGPGFERRRCSPVRRVGGIAAAGLGDHIGEGAQQLGGDVAGVAAGAEHGAAGQGRQRRRGVDRRRRRRERVERTEPAHGGGQVGAGVAVVDGNTLSRSISARCVVE